MRPCSISCWQPAVFRQRRPVKITNCDSTHIITTALVLHYRKQNHSLASLHAIIPCNVKWWLIILRKLWHQKSVKLLNIDRVLYPETAMHCWRQNILPIFEHVRRVNDSERRSLKTLMAVTGVSIVVIFIIFARWGQPPRQSSPEFTRCVCWKQLGTKDLA